MKVVRPDLDFQLFFLLLSDQEGKSQLVYYSLILIPVLIGNLKFYRVYIIISILPSIGILDMQTCFSRDI